MWEYSHTVNIPAGNKKIWDILIDIEKWNLWDKDVKSACLLSPFAEGSKGKLLALDGSKSIFYITKIEALKYYCNFYKLKLFTKLHFKHTIDEIDNDSCKVTFSYYFKGLFSNYYRRKMDSEIKNVMHKAMNNLIVHSMQR